MQIQSQFFYGSLRASPFISITPPSPFLPLPSFLPSLSLPHSIHPSLPHSILTLPSLPPPSLQPNETSYRFSNSPLVIHQAYLIWMPFDLSSGSTVDHEELSTNRFEDNEVNNLSPRQRQSICITAHRISCVA